MIIKFWGVRGSIPTPGPDTVVYGGNTTCVQLTTDDGDIIILDAGSGIRLLGLELMKKPPADCSIFLTHTHWDHIQGLPFFAPLYVPGNNISLYGPLDPVRMKTLNEILSVQMEYNYFPVQATELKANINTTTLHEFQTIQINSTRVTSIMMNHPVLCYGYRVDNNGKSFFFTGDHEPYGNIYYADDDGFSDYQELIKLKQQSIINFIRGVDVFVADSQYTEEEYLSKVGWGHSTFDKSIALAQSANVGRCFLTHHDPLRTDRALESIITEVKQRHPIIKDQILLAKEGSIFIF